MRRQLSGYAVLFLVMVMSVPVANSDSGRLSLHASQFSQGTYSFSDFEGFYPERLVDGNKSDQFATYARGDGADGMYIQIDLHGPALIDNVTVYARVLDEGRVYFFADELSLEASADGRQFFEVDRSTSGILPCVPNEGKGAIVLDGNGTAASHLRILVLNTTIGRAAEISEIEVYGRKLCTEADADAQRIGAGIDRRWSSGQGRSGEPDLPKRPSTDSPAHADAKAPMDFWRYLMDYLRPAFLLWH